MAYKTPSDGYSEKAYWDANKHPVLLAYDEDNDAIKMVRVDHEGNLVIVGTMKNEDGTDIVFNGATSGGVNKLFINTDDLEMKLHQLFIELRKINLHLASLTDLDIHKEDVE